MSHKLNLLEEEKNAELAWYAKGLNFKCTECGKCCTGSPGYIWITEKEIAEMADFLKITIKTFSMKYLRRVGNRYSLVERSKNYDCIFLKDKKCSVYPVRPTQCRTFPYWPHLLKSQQEWEEASSYCEGIRPDAPLVSYDVIQEQLSLENTANP